MEKTQQGKWKGFLEFRPRAVEKWKRGGGKLEGCLGGGYSGGLISLVVPPEGP